MRADIGRPIGGVRHNLDLSDLRADRRKVIDRWARARARGAGPGGRWYSLRVRPYLTLDNKVDGAVLVLVDIDAIKGREQHCAGARLRRGRHRHGPRTRS